MNILGVDPGVGGGYCLFEDGVPVFAHKFESESSFIEFIHQRKIDHAFLEKVGSRPGQGLSTTWTFADNNGFLRGVMRAYGIPVELVRPQEWQKGIGLPKKKLTYAQRKTALKDLANLFCPSMKWTKDTADAYLIGRYGVNFISSTRGS